MAARRAKRSRKPSPEPPAPEDLAEMPEVGVNLKKIRSDRRLSLERLAGVTGVSRAMLGQIELGKSLPTIKTLWRISRALDIPFSALIGGTPSSGTTLLRAAQTRRLANEDGTFTSRALFPPGGPRRTEFYELVLKGHSEEQAVAHAPGTVENLAVSRGTIEVDVRGQTYPLATGDVLLFEADAPHIYRNRGRDDAVLYLVMTYTAG